MRFIFVVQGEGRGHMTQAIALYNTLIAQGHEIGLTIVGKVKDREIPHFFYTQLPTKIVELDSPAFYKDKENKSIKVRRTIIQNLLRSFKFYKNLRLMDAYVKEYKPDAIINFYDFLCGVYFKLYAPPIQHICIGHQFLLEHPDFTFPKKINPIDKFWYFLNTRIAASRASKKLALSFRQISDHPAKKIYVVPPLLRKEIRSLEPKKEDYLLVYMVNSGFSEDIIHWHSTHRHVRIHLFCDRRDMKDETIIDDTLIFHKLNDKKFISMMKNCSGYASTAGFESICEAMYLGKPVMMVPPKGHFEQQCNALDAELSGAGIQCDSFDLSRLIDYIPTHDHTDVFKFKQWTDSADAVFSKHLSGK